MASRKMDKTTGYSSGNFYEQFSSTLPRSGSTIKREVPVVQEELKL
jgi:hypothetical protein